MKIWILTKNTNTESYGTRRLVEEARKMQIEIEIVFPESFEIIVTKEGRKSVLLNGQYVTLPDCLIPRMGAGTTYFALAIIRHLEKLGVFVLNSNLSIETAKDKLASLQILSSNNLPIPKTMLAKFPLNIEVLQKEFSFPLVLKTVSGSEGRGVFLCKNKSQMEDMAVFMEQSKDPRVNVILQEFVATSKGKDIRVIVIGGRPIGAMLRSARRGKFKANFSAGGKVASFELNPQLDWLAAESARMIGLDVAGVDVLFDGDSYKICEVNSSPGFQGFERATGHNVAADIINYVRLRLLGTL